VLVTAVVPGGPADRAEIEPGDVLQAVGEVPVTTPRAAAEAASRLKPGDVIELTILRGGNIRPIPVTIALAYEVAALARSADAQSQPAGVPARTLFPVEALDDAGVPRDAQLVRVNGRLVSTRAEALRAWGKARMSAVVLVRQGERQFFAVIGRNP
jgi:C-terminal processing protease CtpA/Prc